MISIANSLDATSSVSSLNYSGKVVPTLYTTIIDPYPARQFLRRCLPLGYAGIPALPRNSLIVPKDPICLRQHLSTVSGPGPIQVLEWGNHHTPGHQHRRDREKRWPSLAYLSELFFGPDLPDVNVPRFYLAKVANFHS